MRTTGCLVWIVFVALLATATAHAGSDEGWARTKPWSGYWWPRASGDILAPLRKYDQLTGKASVQWELKHFPPGGNTPYWAGLCHGWASAAVLDQEPKQARNVTAPANRQPVHLSVGDQKGLLSASHTLDVCNTFGDRYGDGLGPEDFHDMAPDVLWRLLKLYIKDQGTPLIIDIEPGDEVWNHPVYGYRIQYSPQGSAGEQLARLELWLADDWVPPDFVGTKVRYQTHTFTFRLANGSVVMGSARWVGPSLQDHPDFAWYPHVVRPENPEIDYTSIKQIAGISGSGQPSQPSQPGRPAQPARPSSPSSSPPQPTESSQPSASRPQVAGSSQLSPPPGTKPRPDASPGVTSSHPSGTPPPTALDQLLPGQPLASPPPPNPPPSPRPGPTLPIPGQTAESPVAGPSGVEEPEATPLSPWQLVALIAEKSSAFDLDVTVDRFDGGHYTPEETVTVSGSSQKPGYLYLLAIDSQGGLRLLHPQLDTDNHIPAQQRFFLPGPDAGYPLAAQAPGTVRIKAIVTGRPLLLSGLDWTEPSADYQSRPGGKARWQKFRWPPSEQRQLAAMLMQYQQEQKVDSEGPGELDPALLLGEFAQDEVAFYVGPREGGPPGLNQSRLNPRRD
jgi:hypothetical protein